MWPHTNLDAFWFLVQFLKIIHTHKQTFTKSNKIRVTEQRREGRRDITYPCKLINVISKAELVAFAKQKRDKVSKR